ncbi:MAG: DUF4290 domain-containing protein [Bacteroidetes bacterium]|nr:DUF4290 domain-containing protein [Bacteroidota bacterium]
MVNKIAISKNRASILSIFIPVENMEYNTQLDRLIIPEYGRNIQGMIEFCCAIKEREERNLCAKAIIQVMGQLNPHLRDVSDYTHKLWDHLFIISQFKLDVDSPYPIPSAETFKERPKVLEYPKGKIRYKHYGKTIEDIIRKAKELPLGAERSELTRQIANHLKKSYNNWNKDSITDDVILKNLAELSGGELKLDENVTLGSHQELRGSTPVAKKFFHKNNKHKNNHQGKHKNNNNNSNNRKY